MNRSRILLAGLIVSFSTTQLLAQIERHVRWAELPPIIEGRVVELPLERDRVRGKVIVVRPDALVLKITRTSNTSAYPKGAAEVPRALVREIGVLTRDFLARIAGPAAGAGIGAVACPPAVPILAGLGYLIGRKFDLEKMTLIKIIPE